MYVTLLILVGDHLAYQEIEGRHFNLLASEKIVSKVVVRQQLYSTSFFANSGFSFFQVCPPPNEHNSICCEFLRGIFDTVLTYPKFRYRVP